MSFLDHLVDTAPVFLDATWITLRLTATALVFALLLGSVVAAMSMSGVAVLRWIATGFIGLIRGTPLIAQIFVLYFGIAEIVTLDKFWAGAIALGVHNAAYIAEIIRSGFQSVPKGLDEASRSLGMSRLKTLRRVRAPLALRAILPVLGSQFIIAVKDSSLVAFIGLQELFLSARNEAAATYEPLTMYLIVSLYYLAIVLALTFVVNRLEHRLSAHRR
ncbi:amino acid ABC transporter permease [Nocardioides sp. zg-1228]|uniref:amino acid ABC transporter permease n=1 Tax=Nocardioides sp. zg-1228 TaxID=2763008 RepID=UPI001642D695|nr:amino acid ABC transporter permease [Nocardioides sp. zg-1228]MBC2934575.1 amino acid ABC transporter permease [Nocardioides sp. zg-1228]QSF59328.1 amino acid ABC transporter permease [Nocardioides sp. zg-1228]